MHDAMFADQLPQFVVERAAGHCGSTFIWRKCSAPHGERNEGHGDQPARCMWYTIRPDLMFGTKIKDFLT